MENFTLVWESQNYGLRYSGFIQGYECTLTCKLIWEYSIQDSSQKCIAEGIVHSWDEVFAMCAVRQELVKLLGHPIDMVG